MKLSLVFLGRERGDAALGAAKHLTILDKADYAAFQRADAGYNTPGVLIFRVPDREILGCHDGKQSEGPWLNGPGLLLGCRVSSRDSGSTARV